MSKATMSAPPTTHSHIAYISGTPPQNSRPKLAPNGSAQTFRTSSSNPSNLKIREDELSLDPDELFTKYTVHEVKSILHKLRSDVDAKQEELRSMVGERYRDLLQASTSIISMAQSSKEVLDTVTRMKRTVTSDLRAGKLPSAVRKDNDTEDDELKIFQCLAAHLKLLLDAPEHLWRLLERKRCLHAAWLFLLTRVVYRSLTNEGPEEGLDWSQHGIIVKEQFPLVQRQWESVSQFRAQISHKATLSLREQSLEPKDLCASLLALHLLDSLPLSDALDVFLKQRSRMLQHLHEAIKSTPVLSDKSNKDSAKNVWNVFRSVLAAIIGTVGSARAVFREKIDTSPSMITQVLMSTQNDNVQSDASIPQELRLSSQTLLSSLPNSSHFLALPADIRSYRPFIDVESQSSSVKPETLNSKLRSWFVKATDHLHESAGSWLSHLVTIRKVWEARTFALGWIASSDALLEADDVAALCDLVDRVCKSRIQELWETALGLISSSFTETLRSLAMTVAEEHEDGQYDLAPAEFLLSAPPLPSVTQATLNVSFGQSSFQRFKHGIEQRIDGATPLVHKILSEAENAALKLRDDLNHVLSDEKGKSLEVLYIPESEKTISAILDSLEALSDVETGNSDRSRRRLHYLGRICRRMSLSPLTDYLRCRAAFADDCRARVRHTYDSCVEKVVSAVVLSARDRILRSSGLELRRVSHAYLPTNPSPEMMESLFNLVDSMATFGQFNSDAERSALAKIVLSRFLEAVIESLRRPSRHAELQLIWDLCFLGAVCADWGTSLSKPAVLLDEVIGRSCQSLSPDVRETYPDLETDMKQAASRSIQQVRLLLSPLLSPLDPSSFTKSPSSPSLELNRQKAVNSSLGGDRDTKVPLQLVKPSARFGLLWAPGVVAQ